MENVRRVLGSRFERLSKNTDISNDSREKAFAAWAKKQYKGICGEFGEYGHSSNNCPNHKQNRFNSQTQNQGNNRSRSLDNKPSRDEKHTTKFATGAEDAVTPRRNARASRSASVFSTGKRSTGTQPSRKKIMLRRRAKTTNQTMKVLLRLVLYERS